jgi:DNA primase large subunit
MLQTCLFFKYSTQNAVIIFYSCKSIIMGATPGPLDHHGCPFRHFNETNLRAQLTGHRVDEFDTEDIMRLVKGRHYQVACTRYYEVTRARMLGLGTETLKGGGMNGNGGSEGMVASQELIEHPNQFFEQSFLLMKSHTPNAANGTNGADPSEPQAVPEPTIKGRYTYKKAGVSSHSSNMDLDME